MRLAVRELAERKAVLLLLQTRQGLRPASASWRAAARGNGAAACVGQGGDLEWQNDAEEDLDVDVQEAAVLLRD